MLTIVMTTYDDGEGIRNGYAQACLDSLRQNLSSPDSIKLIIADDGSKVEWKPFQYGMRREWTVIRTNSEHNGIGASLNKALEQVGDNEPWMYTTDDWLLTKPFNLTRAQVILDSGFDYVRVGPPHPGLTARITFNEHTGYFLELNKNEGGFVFATRPFIAKNKLVGPFDERQSSYEVERLYNERVCNSNIYCAQLLTDGNEWGHIGAYNVGYQNFC